MIMQFLLLTTALSFITDIHTYGQEDKSYYPSGYKDLPYICGLPADTGPCRDKDKAFFTRWAFNVTSGMCEKFVYGGCQGNENNFKTKRQCDNCCPTYRSDACPKVTLETCERPVNVTTRQCGGGINDRYTECRNGCPNLCGQTEVPMCPAVCLPGPVCQCIPPNYRRISDCQCLLQSFCDMEWSGPWGYPY